jgi:hypothetical protein
MSKSTKQPVPPPQSISSPASRRRPTIKLSPLPEAGLSRQNSESHIVINPDAELEFQHFRGMLFLGTLAELDLSDPANAGKALAAMDNAADFLAECVVEWRWLDRNGRIIKAVPKGNPSAFYGLSMAEMNWMLESASNALQEDAVPKKS